ncbi:MAG: hypothetical protein JWO19_2922 [Bryobacterales bacterium]|jgi:hypothetical protein|nr:hypothetical protein [Bryobacterales bacterium]
MKLVPFVLAFAGMAYAHHSLQGSFDLKREVRLEGKIIQIFLRNPHSFLQIDVPDPDGNMQRWSLEFPKGAKSLLKEGIEPGTLKVGDRVTVTANPYLKPRATSFGSLVALHRESDGFDWNAKMKRKRS